ncbi:proteasome assembly chaperone family protein [Candidatus Woesearchaeota archaeon]|nr:proteasome assembly chaperone family protein [Candidatus Woesearchaeota archaeon]
MKYTLTRKVRSPTIIYGFPGTGLVGSIATEFLIRELKMEKVGRITTIKLPPVVPIHEGEVVEPMGLFFSKKFNILLFHFVTNVTGLEWQIAEVMKKIAEEVRATEVIAFDGVPSQSEQPQIYYFYAGKKKKLPFKLQPMKEGLVIGVTGALLLMLKRDFLSVFAETHPGLPDSKAAAELVNFLNDYLKLKLDLKPLLEQADKFEAKLKKLVESSQKAASEQEKKKTLSYVG